MILNPLATYLIPYRTNLKHLLPPQTFQQCPNSGDNDLSGISRAKMRSVQQMVVVVLTYIISSTPFIFAQLWMVWGSPSNAVCK